MSKIMFKKIMLTALCAGACLFVYFFIAAPYRISGLNGDKGDCMEPAIKDGAPHFVNHLYCKFNSYKAGDIIVFVGDKVY